MWRSQCNVGPSHLVYLAFETDYFNLDQILHHGALRVAGEKVFRRTRLYFRVLHEINKIYKIQKSTIICTKYLNGREIRIDLVVKV